MTGGIVQLLGGEVPLKRAAWIFLFFLLGTVACASAIPQTDLPETAYNEVDQPINQAPPVVPGIRYVRPASAPEILPGELGPAGRDVSSHALEASSMSARRHAHSLQDLLCIFLI